jgi:hypothetical protein
MALVSVSLGALLAISVTAKSWQQKDWKQWTFNDCFHILSASPWGTSGGGTGPYDFYTNSSGPDSGVLVFIVSAHVARQALVREMELSELYRKMDPAARQIADRKAETCLSQTFNDQIVLHVDPGTIDGSIMFASDGKRVPRIPVDAPFDSVSGWRSITRQCVGELTGFYMAGQDIAFPRIVDGKPTIKPGDRTIRIEYGNRSPVLEFDFRVEKMIYHGKPDY